MRVFFLLLLPIALGVSCGKPAGSTKADAPPAGGDSDAERRTRMVETQIVARGVRDPRVLSAMRTVPRHLFVDPGQREEAYEDRPLPIAGNQTISQPYIVALMTDLLELSPSDTVLEVGTGSGYQAAILAELAAKVYTIEIVEPIGKRAAEKLAALGYHNVITRVGDGYSGWPDAAPFDGILVTAAAPDVPQPLFDQLKTGGRLVIPVGGQWQSQELLVIEKKPDGSKVIRRALPVRFVPLIRER